MAAQQGERSKVACSPPIPSQRRFCSYCTGTGHRLMTSDARRLLPTSRSTGIAWRRAEAGCEPDWLPMDELTWVAKPRLWHGDGHWGAGVLTTPLHIQKYVTRRPTMSGPQK